MPQANLESIVQRMIDAGEPEEAIKSVIQEMSKRNLEGITTGPNPDLTGVTTGPQQPRPGGPGSPLDIANKTPPSEPTSWDEGFRGSLNQLLTKEGINNTLKGFTSGVGQGAVNLAKAAVDPRTYVQSGGPEHQRMLDEATGTRAPSTDYGLADATQHFGTPEQVGELTGNVMAGSVLGAAGQRILPKVPDAMVRTGGAVDRGMGAVTRSPLYRQAVGGSIIGSTIAGNYVPAAIAATPYALQGAGKAVAGAGRLLGGGKPRFMEPPTYPVGTPDLGPPEPPWMEPPTYPASTPDAGPPPPKWLEVTYPEATPEVSPQPTPVPPGAPILRKPGAAPPSTAATVPKDQMVAEVLDDLIKKEPEPSGTPPPEPTITTPGPEARPGVEGVFKSTGRPGAPLDPEIESTLEAAAARREAARAEPTPRRAEPASAEPSGLDEQLGSMVAEDAGVTDPNTVRVLSQREGAKTASQILKKSGVNLSEEGVRTARGGSASIFPEGPRARIDTWLAEHPDATAAQIKDYMYAKNSNALSRTHIVESLKRDGWSDAAIAELMNK